MSLHRRRGEEVVVDIRNHGEFVSARESIKRADDIVVEQKFRECIEVIVDQAAVARNPEMPEGLVEGCRLRRSVARDAVLTYDDVDVPPGRVADSLRAEQYRHFRGETWLEERLAEAA